MNRKINSAQWVRAKRTQANLTQEQLAKEAGLSLRDVQRIEQGDLNMGYRKYLALAIYFGVTMEELLFGEVEE